MMPQQPPTFRFRTPAVRREERRFVSAMILFSIILIGGAILPAILFIKDMLEMLEGTSK